MACCGDVPTLETLAAVSDSARAPPDLRIRVVNVVDLMSWSHPPEHPHGLSDRDSTSSCTKDRPVIFAFHAYPAADPPADLPPHEPRQLSRSRL